MESLSEIIKIRVGRPLGLASREGFAQAMQDANFSPTGVKGRVADDYRMSRMSQAAALSFSHVYAAGLKE